MSNRYLYKSELAKELGISPTTIDYYSREGLLPFTQSEANSRRIYNVSLCKKKLQTIHKLQHKGMKISGIRNYFSNMK